MSSAGANLMQRAVSELSQQDATVRGKQVQRSWRRVVRAACEAAVLAALALLLVGTWFVDRYTVDSNSMAETLLGPHASVECSHCGSSFDVGIEGPDSWQRPVNCANCGAAAAVLVPKQQQSGDTVLVDRGALRRSLPRRWELMAFRAPDAASQVLVKRIVGLPGESIELRDGDVYVDGQIVRKSLAQQRAVTVPVHDNRFRPSGVPGCWQAENQQAWSQSSAGFTGFIYTPSGVQSGELDWLTYHHLRRDGASEETAESAITDVYGYNQTHPVGDVHPVRDLVFSCNVTAIGTGTLYVRASDGAHEFLCTLPANGHVVLSVDGVVVQRNGVELVPNRRQTLEISLVDRNFVLALNGRIVVEYPFERPAGAPTTTTPFALAATGIPVLVVDQLRIDRDVYYGPVIQAGERPAVGSPLVLGDDEYFVLSDNCPLGRDSRYRDFGPAVAAKLFVGKPLLGFGQSQRKLNRPPPIQVPGLSRIRYIR